MHGTLVNEETLKSFSAYCAEFLIHAVFFFFFLT